MGKKSNQGESTDLRGYAIRINQGRVFYFNSSGILVSVPLKEAEMMEIRDLYRNNENGPWMVRRSFVVEGYNNKNAFKSAAAKMREGNKIPEFQAVALSECKRQSTKPHNVVEKPKSKQFVLDVHLPKVYKSRNHTYIKILFVIDKNPKGTSSVAKAASNAEYFIKEAKKRLSQVEELKGMPFEDLPKPYTIRIIPGQVVVEFKIWENDQKRSAKGRPTALFLFVWLFTNYVKYGIILHSLRL